MKIPVTPTRLVVNMVRYTARSPFISAPAYLRNKGIKNSTAVEEKAPNRLISPITSVVLKYGVLYKSHILGFFDPMSKCVSNSS